VKLAQAVGEHPRPEQALRGVVRAGEERVAGEREDHGVRVQRAEAAEREPRANVEHRVRELQRDHQSDEHADESPDERRREELADDVVVVAERVEQGAEPGRLRLENGRLVARVLGARGRRLGQSHLLSWRYGPATGRDERRLAARANPSDP